MPGTISTLEDFLNRVGAQPTSTLVFVDNGEEIKPGYHVTELKSASVRSIDCGRQQNAWVETIVQLLDGHASGAGSLMPVSKFEAIVRAGLSAMPELADAELYFEYAPKNGAVKKYSVLEIENRDERTLVTLGARKAACKPIERYLETAPVEDTSTGCCGFVASTCCAP